MTYSYFYFYVINYLIMSDDSLSIVKNLENRINSQTEKIFKKVGIKMPKRIDITAVEPEIVNDRIEVYISDCIKMINDAIIEKNEVNEKEKTKLKETLAQIEKELKQYN